MSRARLQNTRRAWDAWGEYVTTSRRGDQKSDIAVTQWNNKILATAFSAWKESVASDRQQRTVEFQTVLLDDHLGSESVVAVFSGGPLSRAEATARANSAVSPGTEVRQSAGRDDGNLFILRIVKEP